MNLADWERLDLTDELLILAEDFVTMLEAKTGRSLDPADKGINIARVFMELKQHPERIEPARQAVDLWLAS